MSVWLTGTPRSASSRVGCCETWWRTSAWMMRTRRVLLKPSSPGAMAPGSVTSIHHLVVSAMRRGAAAEAAHLGPMDQQRLFHPVRSALDVFEKGAQGDRGVRHGGHARFDGLVDLRPGGSHAGGLHPGDQLVGLRVPLEQAMAQLCPLGFGGLGGHARGDLTDDQPGGTACAVGLAAMARRERAGRLGAESVHVLRPQLTWPGAAEAAGGSRNKSMMGVTPGLTR